jgi:hypothetical protein
LQKDTLHVTQDGSTLKAPKGFGYQWYKDGKLLKGDTLETLAVKSVGEYKVSVKVDEKSLSRIVTKTLDVQETTSLKPNIRAGEMCEEASSNLSRRLERRFDARGRALKTQNSFQKVYIKR